MSAGTKTTLSGASERRLCGWTGEAGGLSSDRYLGPGQQGLRTWRGMCPWSGPPLLSPALREGEGVPWAEAPRRGSPGLEGGADSLLAWRDPLCVGGRVEVRVEWSAHGAGRGSAFRGQDEGDCHPQVPLPRPQHPGSSPGGGRRGTRGAGIFAPGVGPGGQSGAAGWRVFPARVPRPPNPRSRRARRAGAAAQWQEAGLRALSGGRATQTGASSGRHGDGTRRLRAPRGLQAEPRAALPGLGARRGRGSRPRRGRPGTGAGCRAGGRGGRALPPPRASKRIGHAAAQSLPWAHTAAGRGQARGWGREMRPPRRRQGHQAAERSAGPRPFVSGADSGHTCGSRAAAWASLPFPSSAQALPAPLLLLPLAATLA